MPMYPPLNVQRDVPKIMKVIENCTPKFVVCLFVWLMLFQMIDVDCRAILVSSDVKLFLTTSKLKAKFTSSKGQVLELPSELVHVQ